MNANEIHTLHQDSIVVDGLNASWFAEPRTLMRLREGGVSAVNATLAAWHGRAETLDVIGAVLVNLRHHADVALQVHALADILAAKAAGKVGIIFGFQDTAPIEGRLHQLEVYHRLGVRIMQLTYNLQNFIGCGPQSESVNRTSPVNFRYAIDASSPTAAIGNVVIPCAVAQVVDVCDGCARSHRAL